MFKFREAEAEAEGGGGESLCVNRSLRAFYFSEKLIHDVTREAGGETKVSYNK